MTRAAVLGAGSWGTAFAAVLADGGSDVILWARRDDVAREISAGRNERYLPGRRLPDSVTGTTDARGAIRAADVIVLAVPTQSLRDNLVQWRDVWPREVPVVSLLKGLELGTRLRPSQIVQRVGGTAARDVAVLSGPNLAREVADGQPAACVVAGTGVETVDRIARLCATRTFRPYTSRDVIGVELAGVAKNVIALAVGMAGGLGLGDNTRASLLTRGLAESARLGVAMGADPATFLGLAGVGDLVATCDSPLSRNRTFGEHLGRGLTLEQAAEATKQTTEGVKSCESLLAIADDHDVDMPITTGVSTVLSGRRTPEDMMRLLTSRAPRVERE